MMIFLLCLTAMLTIKFGPDVPFTQLLRQTLVVKPAKWLLQRERHELLFAVIVATMFLFAGEFLAILGPEILIGYAADLALYADLAAASFVVAAYAKIKAVTGIAWASIKSAARQVLNGPPKRPARDKGATARRSN